MVLADSSYPLLNLFWTMFIFFLWVIWIWILITVFIDIFRSHDLSGGAKALWFLFVLFIPLIGVLVYLIARGGTMGERAAGGAQRSVHAAPQAPANLVRGDHAKTQLDSAKGWLAVHNDAVMVLFLVFGVNLIAKGIPPLT